MLVHIFFQYTLYFLCITSFTDRNEWANSQLIPFYFFVVISTSIWLITLFLTETHKPKIYQIKLKYILSSYIKSIFIILLFNSIISIIFDINNIAMQNIIFGLIVYSIIILVAYTLIIKFELNMIENSDNISVITKEKFNQNNLQLEKILTPSMIDKDDLSNLNYFTNNIISKILKVRSSKKPSMYNILSNERDLDTIPKEFELSLLDILLNSVNDIDNTFKKLYDSVIPGGVVLLTFEELEDFETIFLKSNSTIMKYFNNIFYYTFYRAVPKIPFVRSIYKIFSTKRYTVLSKAEVMGRLHYAGFITSNIIRFDGITYVAARKEIEASKNPNPSYYPIIKLDRVGLNGEIIQIHKIRSMYPYSEFLQERVFENNNLSATGKFDGDFRITKPGRIFRKYWLDELPQLLDWFRGEIKLVGIRAMSQHYFSLYSNEYKLAYFSVKPGIISPLFDENTDGFDDIQKIEYEYLVSYLNNPIVTDFKYFFLTVKQILSGIRSK
jgi:lipopolysaccharide/colanic/teichoic acid biosynthesis glycosyltransferase